MGKTKTKAADKEPAVPKEKGTRHRRRHRTLGISVRQIVKTNGLGGIGMSARACGVLEAISHELFDRINRNAKDIVASRGTKTLRTRDIRSALELMIKDTELLGFALGAGTKKHVLFTRKPTDE